MINGRAEALILLACYTAFSALEVAAFASDTDIRLTGDVDLGEPSTHHRVERYVLQACKWHHKNLTYSVGWIPKKHNRKLVEDDIAKAFATWSDHADLTFTPKTGKVDINLRFGKIDGIGKTLAIAFLTCSGVGSVLFDQDELHWGINGKGDSAFYRTAVHEVGHAIGIYHNKVKPSVMNGGSTSYRKGLFKDDIAAVQALYGAKTKLKIP